VRNTTSARQPSIGLLRTAHFKCEGYRVQRVPRVNIEQGMQEGRGEIPPPPRLVVVYGKDSTTGARDIGREESQSAKSTGRGVAG
jgi:hypothetical protein